jgi:hypothetical protein
MKGFFEERGVARRMDFDQDTGQFVVRETQHPFGPSKGQGFPTKKSGTVTKLPPRKASVILPSEEANESTVLVPKIRRRG